VELVVAAIAAKEKEAASAQDSSSANESNKRKISSSTSASPSKATDSKKPKISANEIVKSSATSATGALKAAPSKTASKAPVAAGNGQVTCHRCGIAGHIALDCKGEIDDAEATKDAGAATERNDTPEVEDVKPDVDLIDGTASSSSTKDTAVVAEKNGTDSEVDAAPADAKADAPATAPKNSAPEQPKKKKATPNKEKNKKNSEFVCHYCNATGHKKPFCYKMKDDLAKGITNGGYQQQKGGLLPRPENNIGGGPGGDGRISPATANFISGPPPIGPPLGPPMGPPMVGHHPLGPTGPPPGAPQSIMGVPPAMQRPGFAPPISGPPPFNPGGLNNVNSGGGVDEKTLVENRLEGLRMSRGIRFSWSASDCAFLVMMQDREQRNDQIVKIGSLEQFLQIFGNA